MSFLHPKLNLHCTHKMIDVQHIDIHREASSPSMEACGSSSSQVCLDHQVQVWKTFKVMGMCFECGTRRGAAKQHHESPPSHSLHIECVGNYRVLRGTQNSSGILLICTTMVVEDRGTAQTQDKDIVLLLTKG